MQKAESVETERREPSDFCDNTTKSQTSSLSSSYTASFDKYFDKVYFVHFKSLTKNLIILSMCSS